MHKVVVKQLAEIKASVERNIIFIRVRFDQLRGAFKVDCQELRRLIVGSDQQLGNAVLVRFKINAAHRLFVAFGHRVANGVGFAEYSAALVDLGEEAAVKCINLQGKVAVV